MKVDDYKQVKMYKKRHNELKIFSVMKGRNLYDVVDTACKQYLEKENKKVVEKK